MTEIGQDIIRQTLAEDQEEIITVVRENSGGFWIKPIATEPPDRTTKDKDAFPLHNGETRVNANSTDQRAKVCPISEAYLSGVILNHRGCVCASTSPFPHISPHSVRNDQGLWSW